MRSDCLAIIPARYASTRFPGKPLVQIEGKSMIRRVYERVSGVIKQVMVATDDERIYKEVKGFGGEVVMTSASHPSGTDRCAEAVRILASGNASLPEIVINVQGDEPFVRPDHLEMLTDCFHEPSAQIATLVNRVRNNEVLWDPNRVKVVLDKDGYAMYFSRSPVPFIRNSEKDQWHTVHQFYQHLGMYAYRIDTLEKIVMLGQSSLEKAESLEQLRWIENGYKIKAAVTDHETVCIDTPEDLRKVLEIGISSFE